MGADRQGGGMEDKQQTPGKGREEQIRGRSPEADQLKTGGRPRRPEEVTRELGREDATMHDVMHDLGEEDLDDMRDDR
ncbi:hypothetical protein AB0892_27225 [Streptomyces sp. NPDC005409]|uniref:hypothetical protein n=1 Tax=Streptomyces sp. NPDC005409 TaxID=3155342 RepID=UPI00345588A9